MDILSLFCCLLITSSNKLQIPYQISRFTVLEKYRFFFSCTCSFMAELALLRTINLLALCKNPVNWPTPIRQCIYYDKVYIGRPCLTCPVTICILHTMNPSVTYIGTFYTYNMGILTIYLQHFVYLQILRWPKKCD